MQINHKAGEISGLSAAAAAAALSADQSNAHLYINRID